MVQIWQNNWWQWLTCKNPWKTIGYNGFFSKTIDHSIVLKKWPSLWSMLCGIPHNTDDIVWNVQPGPTYMATQYMASVVGKYQVRRLWPLLTSLTTVLHLAPYILLLTSYSLHLASHILLLTNCLTSYSCISQILIANHSSALLTGNHGYITGSIHSVCRNRVTQECKQRKFSGSSLY